MAANEYLNRPNNVEQNANLNLRDLLVDTMQNQYPDDPVYANGNTYVSDGNDNELRNTNLQIADSLNITHRNKNKTLSVNSSQQQYSKYKINKMLPTIDSFDLDELLDDEWQFYLDPNLNLLPRTDGLFLINREISINPPDFHHQYITSGPATINERLGTGKQIQEVINETFVVFYIENSTALPIPNYKTLEVMLVERDKTYDDIQEATQDQVVEFDLQLDGRFTADNDGDSDPYEEFRFRQMLDRSVMWNKRVRFQSGYVPGNDENAVQFQRDPGEYLLIPAKRFNLDGDFVSYYDDKVFQKQSYREKLREKFEGKLIALEWPSPYNSAIVQSGTLTDVDPPIQSDDKVYLIRMMINGYWKQVIDQNVLRQYALINNIDISGIDYSLRTDRDNLYGGTNDFDQIQGGTIQAGILVGGLYGENGLINTLIKNGGITVLQDADVKLEELDDLRDSLTAVLQQLSGIDPATFDLNLGPLNLDGTVNNTLNDIYQNIMSEIDDYVTKFIDAEKSPAWSDFSHIAEYDRLDATEYEEYINKYSNGGEPFDIEYLQPYEPAGSIKYYPSEQLDALYVQAASQAEIDTIKKDIMELLPDLAARAAELDQRFNAQPDSYESYAQTHLGPDSDIYHVATKGSGGRFKYIKKKNKGTFKEKGAETSFFKLIEKEGKIFRNMNRDAEDEIFYKNGYRDYWRLVGKNDGILTPLRAYIPSLLRDEWVDTIDKDGIGYADYLMQLNTHENNTLNFATNTIGSVTDTVSNTISDATTNAANSIDNVTNNAAGTISNLDPNLDTNIQGVTNPNLPPSVNDLNTQIANGFNSTTANVTTGINQGLDAIGSGIENLGDTVADSISNFGQGVSDSVQNIGSNIEAQATTAIEGAYDAIGGALTFAVDLTSPVDIGNDPLDFDAPERKRAPRRAGIRQGKYLKRNKYCKLCIAAYMYHHKIRKEVTGLSNSNGESVNIFTKALEIDSNFSSFRAVIDNALTAIVDIDQRLMSSTTPAQFIAIRNDLVQINDDFDNIDLTIFVQGENLKVQIDGIKKYMIDQLYSAVQFVREKVYNKKSGKYFIVWPDDAKKVVQNVSPGKSFTNYQDTDYTD